MIRKLERIAVPWLLATALGCTGAKVDSPVSHPPPAAPAAPPAALAPTNGCPVGLAFAWSPDGELTLACRDTVHRLDHTLREQSAFVLEKGAPVIDVAYGGRGAPIWIAREDGTVLAVNIESRRVVSRFRERKIPRYWERVLFPSSDGQHIATLIDNGIAVRDFVKRTRSFFEASAAAEVAWSPDATRIAFWKRGSHRFWLDEAGRYQDWIIAVFEPSAEQPERVIPAYHSWTSSLRFSADGQRLMSTMVDDVALVAWDLASGEKTLSLGLPFALPNSEDESAGARYYHDDNIRWNHSDAAVLLPDESGVVRLPIAGNGIERHDFGKSEPRWSDPFAQELGRLAVSPQGDFVAARCESPSRSPQLCVWDLLTGERRLPASPAVRHTSPVFRLEGSGSGDVLVTGDSDYVLRIWDLARGSMTRKAEALTIGSGGAAFGPRFLAGRSIWSLSPDGKGIVVIPGKGATADVHDTTGGHKSPLSGDIYGTALGATRLYSVNYGSVTAWTLGTSIEKDISVILPVEPPIALSPDGTRFAVGAKAGGIEVRSASPPFALLATRKGVSLGGKDVSWKHKEGIVFSPDSRTLAVTQGHDVFLWDTGEDTWRGPLVRAAPHGKIDKSSPPTFSPSGRTVRFADSGCVLWSFDVRTLAPVGAASICDTLVSEGSVPAVPRGGPRPLTRFEMPRNRFSILFTWAPRWFASVLEDGSIELRRAPGAPLLITLRAISGLDAGYVFTPDGRFDLVGGTPDLARPYIGCSRGGVPVPLHACEALRTPGLLAQIVASLPAAEP